MIETTRFYRLANLCEDLTKTTKKTEMARLIADFLRQLKQEEIAPAIYLIVGTIFPASDERKLNVSWRTVQKVEEKLEGKRSEQPSLSILDVQDYFSRIASASGKGSREKKENFLKELLEAATPVESKYIIKNIFGEMQHGVGEGVIMQAIAKAAGVTLKLVQKACMFAGDLGEVAKVALTEGEEALRKIEIRLFTPIQPMLAQLAEDFSEVFAEHGGKTALEYKFDGARVQIHKKGDDVKIYSRRLSEVTNSLPEIVQLAREEIKTDEALVEGEVVAVDENARPLPFQELMRRFRRVHDIETAKEKIPLKLYLFDLIYLDGKTLIDAPYERRRNLLSQICKSETLAKQIVAENISEAEKFLSEAMDKGHEGLMAKALNSNYSPGAREKKWFKIKPAEHLDLVIVAADWGYGRREGWLSNYHLAARSEETGKFEVVGKTFKGLTDEQFTWITQKLQSLKVSETDYTVRVRPELVVEIAYNEIQKSPHYKSGFALRFARVKRIRDDKSPSDADTIEKIRQLYEKQFQHKAKIDL